jgi:hypothetical protein
MDTLGWTLQDYTNIALAASTIALAIFTIFLAIVTAFPPIFRERKEHYEKLNLYVFGFLSNLKDLRERTDGLNFLRFEATFPPSSVLYQDAEKHLEIDHTGLANRITSLSNDMIKHNLEVDNLLESLDNLFDQSFVKNPNALFDIEKMYQTEKDNIKRITIDRWRSLFYSLSNYSENRTTSQVLEEDIRKNVRIKFTNKQIIVEPGITIAYASNETEYLNFRNIFIDEVLKNHDVLEKISKLKERKLLLIKEAQSISYIAGKIVNSITTGNYKTKAECCPTLWRLFRNYGI